MRIVLACLFIVSSYLGIAQEELNSYKYVIVPKKFEGFKKENQYLTSTMVKFRLVQKGFSAVYDDALPEELLLNRCTGLTINLEDLSGMFSTKIKLNFKDCSSRLVYETEIGKSSIKEFNSAYKEAIENALMSVYKYSPNDKFEPLVVSFNNDVKKIETEKVIEEKATIEEQRFKSMEPKASKIKQVTHSKETVSLNTTSETSVLYAQEIKNGFQLVDSTPKIKIKVYVTSVPDFYLAKSEDKNGLVCNRNGKWFFEYYHADELTVEELNIKF